MEFCFGEEREREGGCAEGGRGEQGGEEREEFVDVDFEVFD